MALPIVAIVGRPNVGKSSLFNALLEERVSIVDPMAGVTRDRVSAVAEWRERYFELVDTGGVGMVDRDDLSEHVERQIRYAVNQATLILFVVDGREGITPLDREAARLLREQRERTWLIANKIDEPRLDYLAGEFIRLGFGEPRCVSAVNGFGRSDLADAIVEHVEREAATAPPEPTLKLALVGRRNVGKSTFINSLCQEDRVIVSEIPGTTRDSVDVYVERDGRSLLVIDTAGVRKTSKMLDAVEYYGYTRAVRSIQRSDVTMFLIDATLPIGQVDKKLAHLIASEYKPCVLVINKWDLVGDRTNTNDYGDYLDKTLSMLDYAPVAFTTARTGRNVFSAVDVAASLFKQARTRVSTSLLNQALREIVVDNPPKPKRGSRIPKLLYGTQVSAAPPTLVLFVDRPTSVTPNYHRFLVNRLRERLPFEEVPLRLTFRARSRRLTV